MLDFMQIIACVYQMKQLIYRIFTKINAKANILA